MNGSTIRLICVEVLAVFIVLVSASSFAVELSVLPQSEFADTEISANIALAVGAVANRKRSDQYSPQNRLECGHH